MTLPRIFNDPVERLLYLSLVVLFLAGGLGILIVSLQLRTINQLGKSIQQQAITVERHTDCVAYLLSQPDHAAVHIQDLQDCKVGP
jgi:hypothetical protein